jgi:hypothetical protein
MSETARLQPATILDLPTELLLAIVESLLASQLEQCVLALALWCRSLCYFILPIVLKGVLDPSQLSSQILVFDDHQMVIALTILVRIPLSRLKGVRLDLGGSQSRPWSYREIIKSILRLKCLVEHVSEVFPFAFAHSWYK